MRIPTKLATAAAAGLLALLSWRSGFPTQVLPAPAQRFVSYYKALDASRSPLGAWEKFLYSLALASAAPRYSSAGGGDHPRSSIEKPTAF